MALPESREARDFYRSGKQRFADVQFLLRAGRTTGAVYLAGYGVECMLKALLIEATPRGRRAELVKSFRGEHAHNFDWLQHQYRSVQGPPIPQGIREHFVLVSTWTTDFRYRPGIIQPVDADDFLAATEAIINWADGRM